MVQYMFKGDQHIRVFLRSRIHQFTLGGFKSEHWTHSEAINATRSCHQILAKTAGSGCPHAIQDLHSLNILHRDRSVWERWTSFKRMFFFDELSPWKLWFSRF